MSIKMNLSKNPCKTFKHFYVVRHFIIGLFFISTITVSNQSTASTLNIVDIPVQKVLKNKLSKLGVKYQVKVGDQIIGLDFSDPKLEDQLSNIRFGSKTLLKDYYINGHIQKKGKKTVLVTTKINFKIPSVDQEIN